MSASNKFQPLALTAEELVLNKTVLLFSSVYGVLGLYEIKSAPYVNGFGFPVIDIAELGSDFIEVRSLTDLGVLPYPNDEWNDVYCLVDPKYHRMMPDPIGEEAAQASLEEISID